VTSILSLDRLRLDLGGIPILVLELLLPAFDIRIHAADSAGERIDHEFTREVVSFSRFDFQDSAAHLAG
jgi:hypothetical protein